MSRPPTIVVIGAASATFGPKVLRDVIHFPALGGSVLRFVDIDEHRLDVFTRLARRINEGLESPMAIESTVERADALEGADYVLISVDVERVETWQQDFQVPVEMGVRQVTGELGGPGGLFHSLRQIPVHLEICRDVERLCPDAVVMVESNPLNRICLAMRRHSEVGRIVGLCHGVEITQSWIGGLLGLDTDDVLATAAGVNHFHWVLDLRHRTSGEDLYPALRRKLKEVEPGHWALSCKLLEVYGYLPSCGDAHIGEYLPYAWEFVGLEGPDFAGRAEGTRRLWEYYEEQAAGEGPIRPFEGTQQGAEYEERLQWFFAPRNWTDTLAFPIINAVHTGEVRRMPAVNLLNEGTISNLPDGVFVETPGIADASGLRPVHVGPLPGPLAAFCRRDIDQMELTVEAAVRGDRGLVLQAMLLDPVVDSVRTAEKVLDRMLELNAHYLPQFR